jgi:hypothetical protein
MIMSRSKESSKGQEKWRHWHWGRRKQWEELSGRMNAREGLEVGVSEIGLRTRKKTFVVAV